MVSIIIPFYNAELGIEKCIKSILQQTYTDFEVILVDDCSTDNSYSICKTYADNDSRIMLIGLNENSGVSTARNKGLENSLGDFIAFVDADDTIHPNFLSTMVLHMKRNEIDMVVCGNIESDENATNILWDINGKSVTTSVNEAVIKLFNNGEVQPVVWAKLFKRKIIFDNQLRFSEDIAISEDIKFVFEYLTYCENNCAIIEDKLYNYIINSQNSAMQSMNGDNVFKKKWLSSWTAGIRMTEIAAKRYGMKSNEYKVIRCSQISRARMQLHLLYDYNEDEAKNQRTELIAFLRKNWIFFFKNDYSSFSRKLMVAFAAFFPNIEHHVWKRRK